MSAFSLSFIACCLLLSTLSTPTSAVIEEHRVHSLPGATSPLESPWFSGSIYSGTKPGTNVKLYYHYTLILSHSSNPFNDPLLLWTNGGPGASSLWGLFTEVGPFYLSSASLKTAAFNATKVPSLFRFPYAWSKLANLLILNGPPPVGFSYCDPPGPTGDGYGCGEWTDNTTAIANFQFLEHFFEAYPEFTGPKAEFYLSGESYAGVYIPTLVREIIHHRKDSLVYRLLKGVAIGDGCVGMDVLCLGTGAAAIRMKLLHAEFLYGHGQISRALYSRIESACRKFYDYDPDHPNRIYETSRRWLDETCKAELDQVEEEAGFYFPYALYDECWDDANLPNSNTLLSGSSPKLKASTYPCGGGKALDMWLSHPQVKTALHVPLGSEFVNGDNGVGLGYKPTERNLLPVHRYVARNTKLRTLIYNGDTDPALNTFASEWWVTKLGLEVKEKWSPWTLDGKAKVVGYVTRYVDDFDYLTVRGSGHMVPQMKPQAAYEMMRAWLKQEPWKKYKGRESSD